MATGVWISLILYFLLMLAIGVYAWRKSTSSSEEYMLGGRNLPPAVAALSAGASDMSGWLLLGLPGALYAAGLVESWIGIGLFVGALVNWIVVAPRLREQTERYDNSLTIPGFLANRFPTQALTLRVISAVVIVVFFAVYTASGLVGGGKLFQSAFGGNYQAGVWLTLGVVLAYTVIGGFLAVSLTDFVQGCIMMLALIIMPLVVLMGPGGGGFDQARETLAGVDPEFLSLTRGLTVVGFLSAVTWGLGYFGQPHIIVRFMAVRSVREVPTARNIGMGWMAISLLGAVGLGIFGRAYVVRNGLTVEDPETIFILLADLLFHPLVTGFLFAALLAAIMSTVSSQLLVSSSSLTEDFYRLFFDRDADEKMLVMVGRIAVLAVGIVAAFIARDPNSSVLSLVSNAWAGFGAAFGPLIILSLTWSRMTGLGAVAGLVVGAVTVMIWIWAGLNSSFLGGPGVYEIIPGFLLAGLAIIGVSLMTEARGEFRPLTGG
ncbi:MAG: sodium/proline symporter PutP [Paracoccus sp. (in: a-proteobacteria)]|jgi:SSS family solute:Na+ symporter|uniref:sodium/proline symporter PutP n=2 Tax=Paracoccus TaxID=265 RepID=UPI000C69C92D|nr:MULTISPECIES: sodium/proline symporter PutP [unclassified Paracoccus (in: a-proteobacteria)]MAN56401.1 sodium/proline symporter PutP [Paracoccus sp. (in: a-proteobacteria)]MAN57286.1 sodium/proline symporter PutP [Paracoccus sp. (in: a-proteobacteria)]MBA48866.1 sodium/proline symporter PutP [Paracoccus sp. (in: a-proteobacteria)]|tara:strand:- start:3360 stop:4829 length:1470 start_codon:yes stop_codon:yes gene_type:complete